MAGFPDQPERFVGRYALMTTISTALRPGSGSTAVLLQGMPGIGKTACALELAYLCQDQFSAAAFWRPPAESDPELVLRSLADALAQAAGPVGGAASRRRPAGAGGGGAPTHGGSAEDMRASRVLVVVDNIEELLHPDGGWRDARWGAIFDALAAHRWRVPAGSDQPIRADVSRPSRLRSTCLRLPVGPLSWAEAATVAREVPALRTLMFDGRPAALSPFFNWEAGWQATTGGA